MAGNADISDVTPVSDGGAADPADPADPAELLRAALSALAAVPLADLSDAALSAAIEALDPLVNRLDAVRSSLLAAWDARLAWAADGARSGAGWLASHTESSRPAAAATLRTARALRSMPATDAAFRSGVLGSAKVRLLARACGKAPQQFAEQESWLVGLVRDLRVDEAARVLEFWAGLASPGGAASAAEKLHDGRSVQLSQTIGGVWVLNGQLPPEQGEVLRNQLDAITKRMRAADLAAVEAGDLKAVRTAAQLRADALILLVMQGSTAGEDGNPVNVPSVTLIVNIDDLAATSPDGDSHGGGWPADRGDLACDGDGDGNAFRHDRRPDRGDVRRDDHRDRARRGPIRRTAPVGQTEHGEPVSAEAALRHTCDASCARVVFGPDSTPVDLGVAARLPSPAQRRALAARDRGCTFPGCDLPPGWTNAHHLVHWIHGGPTDLANLALLCVHHHHRVHEGGFTVTRQADGTLEFRRPDGTLLTVPKQRAPNRHPPPKAA